MTVNDELLLGGTASLSSVTLIATGTSAASPGCTVDFLFLVGLDLAAPLEVDLEEEEEVFGSRVSDFFSSSSHITTIKRKIAILRLEFSLLIPAKNTGAIIL